MIITARTIAMNEVACARCVFATGVKAQNTIRRKMTTPIANRKCRFDGGRVASSSGPSPNATLVIVTASSELCFGETQSICGPRQIGLTTRPLSCATCQPNGERGHATSISSPKWESLALRPHAASRANIYLSTARCQLLSMTWASNINPHPFRSGAQPTPGNANSRANFSATEIDRYARLSDGLADVALADVRLIPGSCLMRRRKRKPTLTSYAGFLMRSRPLLHSQSHLFANAR